MAGEFMRERNSCVCRIQCWIMYGDKDKSTVTWLFNCVSSMDDFIRRARNLCDPGLVSQALDTYRKQHKLFLEEIKLLCALATHGRDMRCHCWKIEEGQQKYFDTSIMEKEILSKRRWKLRTVWIVERSWSWRLGDKTQNTRVRKNVVWPFLRFAFKLLQHCKLYTQNKSSKRVLLQAGRFGFFQSYKVLLSTEHNRLHSYRLVYKNDYLKTKNRNFIYKTSKCLHADIEWYCYICKIDVQIEDLKNINENCFFQVFI